MLLSSVNFSMQYVSLSYQCKMDRAKNDHNWLQNNRHQIDSRQKDRSQYYPAPK